MDDDFKNEFEDFVAKHDQGIILGLKEITGNVANRQEIDSLLKNEEDTFNLLILALRSLKHQKPTNIMSFFQIASIHGYPLTAWNDIGGKKTDPTFPNPNNDGYCPHGKNTFPVWHRPYIAMLEQAIFIEMVRIAAMYDDEAVIERYVAAAMKFRLPYWDYWRPRGYEVTFPGVIDPGNNTTYPHDYSVPRILTEQTVMVKMYPKEELTSIKNPFWHFIFSKYSGSLQDREWNYMDDYKGHDNLMNRSQTTRHPFPVPDTTTIQDVVWDNPIRMNSSLNEMRMDATRIALKMLSKSTPYASYELFSCSTKDSQTDPGEMRSALHDPSQHEGLRKHMTTSLEGIHNMYHVMIGGLSPGGHMSRVPTAAFDPIFWFHHNQIERIFSIWQSIHDGEKDAWFEKDEDAESSLLPFISGPYEKGLEPPFWTPNAVKSPETFGYTYADILDTPDKTIQRLQHIYGWSVAYLDTETQRKPPPDCEPLDLSDVIFFKYPRKQNSALLSANQPGEDPEPTSALALRMESLKVGTEVEMADEETIWEWEISDQIQRHALGGSGAILYYILKENDTFIQYTSPEIAPTLAGMTVLFASPSEGCMNCASQKEDNVVMRNSVAITSQLMDYVQCEPHNLPSLDPKDVIPFLKKRLRWQIMDVNGVNIDPRQMAQQQSFYAVVNSTKSTIGERARGEYGEPVLYPEIVDYIIDNADDPTHDRYLDQPQEVTPNEDAS